MYSLHTSPAAQRQMARLERRLLREDWERLRAAVQNLAVEPRPAGARKIVTWKYCYSIRVGDYRIVFEVRDKESIVLIIKIGRRNESTYDF